MIHVATIRLQSEPVGRLRVDPLQIRSDGGPLMPALIVYEWEREGIGS